MRKILLLTLDFPPRFGGVARYLHCLATYFKDQILVIAPKETETAEDDQKAQYPIERLDLLFRFMWPGWLRSVFELIKRRATYEVVFISHILPLGTAAWIASWITHKPYFLFVHGFDLSLSRQHPRKYWLTKKILKNAHLVIANSKALCQEIKKEFVLKEIIVIYPPVFINEAEAILSKTIENHEKIYLLTVSRLVKRKGHLRVLEALGNLRKRGYSDFIYWIVGSGPMKKEIEEKINALGLLDQVKIFPLISDQELQNFYKKADIFIMPTIEDPIDREGFGMVYLEAGAYGIPCIATNQPGVNEAVIHEKTGLLVQNADKEGLCRAIELLYNDKVKRQILGKQARERILQEFTALEQFSKLETYL